jgi:hypothetical protein
VTVRQIKSRTWSTNQDNTDRLLYTRPTGKIIGLMYISGTVSANATNDVQLVIGLGEASIEVPVDNDWDGVENIGWAHPGIPNGGGGIGGPASDAPLCTGGPTDNIYLTNTHPGGGRLFITVAWTEIDE